MNDCILLSIDSVYKGGMEHVCHQADGKKLSAGGAWAPTCRCWWFWASWCGPCQALGPIVEEVAAQAEGFKVGKVNVDEEPELARQYRVMSHPHPDGLQKRRAGPP